MKRNLLVTFIMTCSVFLVSALSSKSQGVPYWPNITGITHIHAPTNQSPFLTWMRIDATAPGGAHCFLRFSTDGTHWTQIGGTPNIPLAWFRVYIAY